MKSEQRFKRVFLIFFFVMIVLVPVGFIVMALWNNILVPVLHISLINFWQALGILLLSKILFGGFPGGWRNGGGGPWKGSWRNKMKEKWNNMTPEEREKFQQNWRNRCAGWGRDTHVETGSRTSGETTAD